ncbi:MAG: Integral membrane protein with CBS domain [Methanosaeta sp. NSP1]|nr:MAG: Integral membrane protein with CBS domain [Methanosaeta sp. NSP1]
MSLSKIRLIHMLEEKVRGARVIERLKENPSKLLGTILVGNNIVNIGASSIATLLAIKHFGDTSVAIATGITTVLVLIFGCGRAHIHFNILSKPDRVCIHADCRSFHAAIGLRKIG